MCKASRPPKLSNTITTIVPGKIGMSGCSQGWFGLMNVCLALLVRASNHLIRSIAASCRVPMSCSWWSCGLALSGSIQNGGGCAACSSSLRLFGHRAVAWTHSEGKRLVDCSCQSRRPHSNRRNVSHVSIHIHTTDRAIHSTSPTPTLWPRTGPSRSSSPRATPSPSRAPFRWRATSPSPPTTLGGHGDELLPVHAAAAGRDAHRHGHLQLAGRGG